MFSKWRVIFLSLIILTGCSKDEDEFSTTPEISFVSISPSTATEFSDNVTIIINYKDGDGDLGENKDGVKNCFVTDNRIGVVYEYRIKQLAPSGSAIAITGNLEIKLGGQTITDNSNQQSVSYTLYLKDRAGNSSNSVTTSAITIRK
jgi:hypothetical protein